MRMWFAAALLAPLAPLSQPAHAQEAPVAQAPGKTVTVEYYYRIKWGALPEFKRLYKSNHQPLLREMRKAGLIVEMRTDEPFTHMAGGERWDMRVTITFRDGASAVELGGAWDTAFDAAKARLYPDKAKFEAEEAQRFALIEEHWDVIVYRAD